jgi:hypothetical protein
MTAPAQAERPTLPAPPAARRPVPRLPRLVAAQPDDERDDLPVLTLSDVEEAITRQLAAHGLSGAHEARGREAARNVVAAIWLAYQDALSGRATARARAAELEAQLERRRCAHPTHDWRPSPITGAHVCARCGALGGGVLEP